MDGQSQLTGLFELRIVGTSVHSDYNEIKIRRDLLGIPARLFRTQARFLKPRQGWIKQYIIGTGHVIALPDKLDGNVVHHRPANGNYVNFFHRILLIHQRWKNMRIYAILAASFSCQLSAFGYWLLAFGCWLLAAGYWMLAFSRNLGLESLPPD